FRGAGRAYEVPGLDQPGTRLAVVAAEVRGVQGEDGAFGCYLPQLPRRILVAGTERIRQGTGRGHFVVIEAGGHGLGGLDPVRAHAVTVRSGSRAARVSRSARAWSISRWAVLRRPLPPRNSRAVARAEGVSPASSWALIAASALRI